MPRIPTGPTGPARSGDSILLAGARIALDPSLPAREQLSRWIALGVGSVGIAPGEGREWSEEDWARAAEAVLEALSPYRDVRELLPR